jgi:outer membrane protein assembly factor BamB
MKTAKTVTAVTVGAALIYLGIVVGWHLYDPRAGDFAMQTPGADNRPEGLTRAADDVVIGEFFMKYADLDSPLTGTWSRFRGANLDNIVETDERIDPRRGEFPVLWSVTTGEGHAAPVIRDGRVYFLDYIENMSSDALRCFSLETGEELWRRWYRVSLKRNHGFSRTIPAVGDGYIVTIGPEGHVMCCDPVTGDLLWTLDMKKQFATEVPFWYAGQCACVDGETLVLAPAGEETLLAGVDIRSGEVVWTTPNTPGFKMSHSSVMPMTLGGKRTYVYIGVGGVCGVSAEQGDPGSLLWTTGGWQPTVAAPSPLQLSSDRVFLVAGYGNGGALLNVTRSGGGWTATIADQYKAKDGLASEQQTPILYGDMIISIMPKDGGARRSQVVLHSPADLHDPVWTSAADERFGLGPYMVINDHLFILKDEGELFVYEISPRSMSLVGSQKILEGVDAWGPMAYADGMLVLRDAHNVICLKIAANG